MSLAQQVLDLIKSNNTQLTTRENVSKIIYKDAYDFYLSTYGEAHITRRLNKIMVQVRKLDKVHRVISVSSKPIGPGQPRIAGWFYRKETK